MGVPYGNFLVGCRSPLFAEFDPEHIITGTLSVIVAGLSAVITSLEPSEQVDPHRRAGNSHDTLMNKSGYFCTIECWQSDLGQGLTESPSHFSQQKDDL